MPTARGPRRPARGQDRDLDGERSGQGRPPVRPRGAARGLDRRRGPGGRARAHVVAAFHLVPAAALADLDHHLTSDVLVVGEESARAIVLDLIDGIPDLRAFDAGPLANALGIEAFSAALLTVNLRHKGEGSLRIDGIGPASHDHDHRTMTIRLFDTAQRAVVPFEVGPVVRMYVCGITPYDSTHLGHAATYLTYDLLIRRLEELGHEVRMVRNVTDVDDSILPKARELGVPYLELAEAELARFRSDMEALGHASAARRAARHRVDRRHDRHGQHAPRRRPRLPHPRHRLLRRVDVPALRRAVALLPRPHGAPGPDPRRQPRRSRTAATRSTSCSGSRRSPTSRRGARPSASAAPVGTSSAR